MYRISKLLVTGVLIMLASSFAQAQTQEELSISQLFPSNIVSLEFLQLSMSKRGSELAIKFSNNTDSQWLASYVARVSEPGRPLPYHPKFGLSESEYKEFLEAASQKRMMPNGQTLQCRVNLDGDTLSLKPINHPSQRMESIILNVKTTEASASGVDLGRAKWKTNSGENSAIGAWRGYLWSEESGDAQAVATGGDIRLVKIDLLHLLGTNYVYFRHKFVERKTGKPPVSVEFEARFKVDGVATANPNDALR